MASGGSKPDEILSKFVLGGRRFYFYSIWNAVSFVLYVTECKRVWMGKATSGLLEELTPPGMVVEEYQQLTRRALTKQGVEKKSFSYKLKQVKEDNSVVLTWRIKLSERGLGFSVKGELSLSFMEKPFEMLQDLLDWTILRQQSAEESQSVLRQTNNRLKRQLEEALSQLQQLAEEKCNLESEMYLKFVEIVNEKKQRIRELVHERKKETTEHEKEVKRLRTKIKRLRETGPSEWHGSEGILNSSDESEEADRPRRKRKRRSSKGGESSSAAEKDTTNSFSLTGQPTPSLSLLEDIGTYQIKTTVRKRHRKQAAQQSQNDSSENTPPFVQQLCVPSTAKEQQRKLVKMKLPSRLNKQTERKNPTETRLTGNYYF